jgi:hypothetical protein
MIGKGRLYVNKGMKVFVASGNACPRMKVCSGANILIRDDYSAGIRIAKKLAALLE